MPDQLQLRGGTTAEHSTFTGAIKEVTVDTTKKTAVVHDGTTAGGVPLLRQDGSNSALALGSEGTPSLKWDANTGIFSPGEDQLAFVTNANRAITITSTQAVGIKTANPSTALHVAGSTRVGANSAADAFLEIGKGATGDRNSYIDIVADTTYTDYGLRVIRNNTGFNATSEIKHRGTGAFNIVTQEAAPIVFNTTNSPRVTILPAGNVGIGTSNPSTALHVNGDGTFGSTSSTIIKANGDINFASNYNGILSKNSSYVYLGSTNNSVALWPNSGTNASPGLIVDNANRVGIGTTSPGLTLDIKAATDGLLRVNNSNESSHGSADARIVAGGTYYQNPVIVGSSIKFNTYNGSAEGERARVDSSGRLLVGTSTSSASTRAVFQGNSFAGSQPGIIYLQRDTSSIGLTAGTAMGYIIFADNAGSNYAVIGCEADASTGTNDYPSRLVFSTTADGASSPTERLHIKSNTEVQWKNVTELFPVTDNACSLGKAGNRWSAVWAANGTIQTSDERAKTNISDATLGSDFVKALRPVSYKWIEGGKRHTGEYDANNNCVFESVSGTRTHWGFIAQEVKEAVDAAGVDFGGWVLTDKDDPDSQQALRYDQFIAPLTKALQEAMERIEQLEARLTAAGIN